MLFFVFAAVFIWFFDRSIGKWLVISGKYRRFRLAAGKERLREDIAADVRNLAGGVTLAQEETTLAEPGKKYPGNVWGRKLGWCYLLYFVLTVAILEVGKKPLPLLAFWLLYGITSGIYARGLASFYGRLGEYYSFTAVLVIPSVLAVLTGIFWIKPGLEPGLSYVPYQKRIRDILLVLRIRLLPSCFYAAALLLCYVTDYEIVKRIQWRLLLRMLRNVVN